MQVFFFIMAYPIGVITGSLCWDHVFFVRIRQGYFDRVHEGGQGHPVDALGRRADACAGDDDYLKRLRKTAAGF